MAENVQQNPYRKAKAWHVALGSMTGVIQMAFYVLLGYAAYIGNLGYAIATGVVGVLITLSRVFDSVTDPIIALFIEKFKSKFGKMRFFLVLGWLIMAIATTLMCNVFAGNFSFSDEAQQLSSPLGITVFILIYALYIIGYTFVSCTGNMTGNIITNDPKQRPMLGVWQTIYSYLSPMIVSMVIITAILPKFGIATVLPNGSTDYQWTNEVFFYSNFIVVGVSFIALVLTCIGLTPYDKPENFEGIKKSKVSFKDMWLLVKDNKEFQRYLVAATSDKLAQTVSSQSVISTLLFSVLLGSMVGSAIISVIAMLPSIIFAFIGAKLAGKQGNRKVMIVWSWACIAWNVLFALFVLFVPEKSAGSIGLPLILFFVLMLGNNALKMVVSAATGAMRMDVVDYELERSGKYLPATVSAVYSFIDKLISSVAPMFATLLIGIVGYTGSKIPQAGDPLTIGIRIIIAILYCGLPIIGWLLNELAMRKFSLTKERMVQVQENIAELKIEATKDSGLDEKKEEPQVNKDAREEEKVTSENEKEENK